MLTQYIQAAMTKAVYEYDEEDGQWYGEIPPCRGVIGMGIDQEACESLCVYNE